MHIEHLAIWVRHLEYMKNFYVLYFDGSAGEKYINPRTDLETCFIVFGKSETRLELMTRPDIEMVRGARGFTMGLAHFTISAEGKQKVDELTARLRKDQFTVLSEPRTTGDGYYESVILDPKEMS